VITPFELHKMVGMGINFGARFFLPLALNAAIAEAGPAPAPPGPPPDAVATSGPAPPAPAVPMPSAGLGKSGTCGALKYVYQMADCCGQMDKVLPIQFLQVPTSKLFKNNICKDKKPYDASVDANGVGDGYFNNEACANFALEQSGANVTKGYKGSLKVMDWCAEDEVDLCDEPTTSVTEGRRPITTTYLQAGLCPVNVHWHIGTEHLSMGEFDHNGKGPATDVVLDWQDGNTRRLDAANAPDRHLAAAAAARIGFRCHHYNPNDPRFTTEYAWQHCIDMKVGETYEVHWPHSAAGACGTPYQYNTPFYDGVFCKGGIIALDPLNTWQKIGVQAQIFTIINDEDYFYPNLFNGAIVDGDFWKDVGKYTGSTTGTTRNNQICSKYTPITWQVDRKCHLISASSFDQMCATMKLQADDMSGDLHAHGSRELVLDAYAANNLERRLTFADE